MRTKLAQAFNHWLNVPEDKLQVRNLPISSLLAFKSSGVYCCRRLQGGEEMPNLMLKSVHDLTKEVVYAVEDKKE